MNQELQDLFDTLESQLALAGYKIMDISDECLIIRDSEKDLDYEIKVTELIP